jgi:hypothetical protein
MDFIGSKLALIRASIIHIVEEVYIITTIHIVPVAKDNLDMLQVEAVNHKLAAVIDIPEPELVLHNPVDQERQQLAAKEDTVHTIMAIRTMAVPMVAIIQDITVVVVVHSLEVADRKLLEVGLALLVEHRMLAVADQVKVVNRITVITVVITEHLHILMLQPLLGLILVEDNLQVGHLLEELLVVHHILKPLAVHHILKP